MIWKAVLIVNNTVYESNYYARKRVAMNELSEMIINKEFPNEYEEFLIKQKEMAL